MVKKLNLGYGLDNGLQNLYPLPILASRAPGAGDVNYSVGTMWIRTSSNQAWILTSIVAGAATWALSSPGSSDVDTLTGDGGGAISPAGGNITLAGGTNITSAGAGNTITFNLDPAIVLATSVTSPLYTAGAGVNVQVTAQANRDIRLQMGDAAGVNVVSFRNSAAVEVFSVNSLGTLAMAALTVTGALTQTAGVVNIGQDNAANAINIGGGNAARAIGVGNSAAAHVLTLGSITGAAQTVLQSGTVGIQINATGAASPLTLDSVGVLELNSSAGAIGIGNDAVAQNMNIGTGAAQRTITIGNATLATSVVVNGGTGAMSFGANATDHTTTIGSTNGVSATALQSGTGNLTVNGGGIMDVDAVGALSVNSSGGAINVGNDAVAQNMNIGTGAAQRVITIGNATLATSVVVNGGTGAMSFGANATDHTTTIGSTNGVSASTLQAGTGALSVAGGGIIDVDAVGALSVNSSGGVINVGNDVVAQNINIGTGGVRTITIGDGTGATSVVVDSGTGAASFGANATDHTTTIGSTTGVSATVIQSGSGKIDLAGVVGELTADFIDVSGDKVTFTQSPILQSALNTGVAPTGATSDVNLMSIQTGMIMEEFVIGAGQTIIAPRMGAAGLLISGDLTATEGYEYSWGATRDNSKHSFTIGTSAAFYLQWRYTAADVSGCEPAFVGFRKTQAYQTVGALSSYTDYACFGLDNGVSTGKAIIQTQLNTGGVVSTDTTDAWADGGTHTLRINVSAAGVVTFLYDGAPPSVTQAFTFDNGDIVHPFWRHEFNAGAPGAINWVSMECGFQ